jgi:DNA-binding protein H-NS
MPRKSNLASMSVDALFKLRDDVSKILSARTSELQDQLSRLTGSKSTGKRRGRPPGRGSKLRGKKVAPKYRGPRGVTWSGRGLRPRWLVAELKKGRKLEHFAIKKAR